MNILIGKRQHGKTSHLIQMSAAGEGTIVAPTEQSAQYIKNQAKAMGLDIPEPIRWNDLVRGKMGQRGPYLLDELGAVLNGLNIKTATLDDGCVVEKLADKKETQSEWAGQEVALAIAAEKKLAEGSDDWTYGAACYESALRAYQSLSRDGHDGYSIQIIKGILNRLIDGKCLTPIEDTPDIWSDISEVFSKGDKKKHYQCKRMSSLFKEVAEDGTVTLSDTSRVYCVNVEDPDTTFTNGFATRLIDKIFPIAMPYFPANKKFKVIQDEFLVDPKNGDYDTIGYICIMTPEGKKVELNRYFKEDDGKMVQIEKAEFDERKTKRVDKK